VADNLVIAENPAFLLLDMRERKLFESEYQSVASLYYKEQPSFEELLVRINQHISAL
jgi:hypothetical protein